MTLHRSASILSLLIATVVLSIAWSAPGEARCRVWQATHNGSGLFYPRSGGSAGTAIDKLHWQVDQWRKRAGLEGVNIGKAATWCYKSRMKYLLPHRHCVARARVCY